MSFDSELDYIREKYHLGESLYQALYDKRPADTDIVISPMELGDTVWLSALAEAYRSQNNCRVMFVVKESQSAICKYYPAINYVLPIDTVQMEALTLFIVCNGFWHKNRILYANHQGEIVLTNNGYLVSMNIGHYPDILVERRFVLGLSDDAIPVNMSIPVSLIIKDELVDRYHNSVLLMPGARSYSCLPADFWIELASTLKSMGYDVYTNYNGLDCEYLIEGTQPLASTLPELLELSRYIPRFIGLRSGICDFLASAGANIDIVYNRSNAVFPESEGHFPSSPEQLSPVRGNIKNHLWTGKGAAHDLIKSLCA